MFWSHQLPGVPSLLGLYLLFVFNKHSPMETHTHTHTRYIIVSNDN